jgi:hypothetical protein
VKPAENAVDAICAPRSTVLPLAGVAQLVEHHLAKVDVESSSLFARSISEKRLVASPAAFSWPRAIFSKARAAAYKRLRTTSTLYLTNEYGQKTFGLACHGSCLIPPAFVQTALFLFSLISSSWEFFAFTSHFV